MNTSLRLCIIWSFGNWIQRYSSQLCNSQSRSDHHLHRLPAAQAQNVLLSPIQRTAAHFFWATAASRAAHIYLLGTLLFHLLWL